MARMLPQSHLDAIIISNTRKEVRCMRNIFYILFACFILVSCGTEGIDILKDTEKTAVFDWDTKDSENRTFASIKNKRIIVDDNDAEFVDEKNVVGTTLIADPKPEPDIENVEPQIIDVVEIEPEPIRIDDADKPETVLADTPIKLMRVDKYEVSIEAYCKVFPHMREALHERIIKSLRRGIRRWPEPNINQYPAVVTYVNAVRYAEAIGRRLPTTEEWKWIAGGAGNKGTGNHGKGWICLTDDQYVKHVDNNNGKPNGYGTYEMVGNVSEWCDGRRIAGISFRVCDGNIRKWFPIGMAQFENTTAGFRCVENVQ